MKKKKHLIAATLLIFVMSAMTACGKSAGISDDTVKKDFVTYMKNDELQDVEVDSMDIKTEKEDSDFVIKNVKVAFSTNSVDYERQYVMSYEKENGNWSLFLAEGVNESSWTRTFENEISCESMAKMIKDAQLVYTDSAGEPQKIEIGTVKAEDIVINSQDLDFEKEEGTVNATFSFTDEDGQKYKASNADIVLNCGEIHDGKEYWKLYLGEIEVTAENITVQ